MHIAVDLNSLECVAQKSLGTIGNAFAYEITCFNQL